MKKLTIALLAVSALAATSFAGTEVYSGKDNKKVVVEPTCFNDQELQIDVFGVYQDGNANVHAGPIRDHGWGGGIGINYFFHRNIGVGAEGFWTVGKENAAAGNGNDRKEFHNLNGSLIFRLPIDSACIAPYAFLGAGAVLDGDSWFVGFTGVGLEYRVVPHKVGLFIDARWNYFGDRYGHGDQNNFTARTGVRWVF